MYLPRGGLMQMYVPMWHHKSHSIITSHFRLWNLLDVWLGQRCVYVKRSRQIWFLVSWSLWECESGVRECSDWQQFAVTIRFFIGLMVFVVMSYSIHGWGCGRHTTWCVDSPPFIHDIQYIVICIIAFTISDIHYAVIVSKGIHVKKKFATSTNINFLGKKTMLSVVFIFNFILCFPFFGQWITLLQV